MNTSTPNPQPNLNRVQTTVPPKRRAQPLDPVRIFVDMNLAAKFWFLLFVAHALLVHIPQFLPKGQPEPGVVILDEAGNTLFGRLQRFADAKKLHRLYAEMAVQTFLNRSPLEFDNPALLELLFLNNAFAKAQAQFKEETPERAAKQIHQKAEIANIALLETRDDRVLVTVTGQLIRTGVFQQRGFSEGLQFRMSLRMLRNPNITQNARMILAVQDFDYETHR